MDIYRMIHRRGARLFTVGVEYNYRKIKGDQNELCVVRLCGISVNLMVFMCADPEIQRDLMCVYIHIHPNCIHRKGLGIVMPQL